MTNLLSPAFRSPTCRFLFQMYFLSTGSETGDLNPTVPTFCPHLPTKPRYLV